MVVEVPVGRAGSLGSKGGTMPPLVASSRMRVPAFSYVNDGMYRPRRTSGAGTPSVDSALVGYGTSKSN
jgi:hypothetical protein